MLLRTVEELGAGDAPRSPAAFELVAGLVSLDPSVSGGVGTRNCVPLKLSGLLLGDASSGADRLRGLGEAGLESMSSILGHVASKI